MASCIESMAGLPLALPEMNPDSLVSRRPRAEEASPTRAWIPLCSHSLIPVSAD